MSRKQGQPACQHTIESGDTFSYPPLASFCPVLRYLT